MLHCIPDSPVQGKVKKHMKPHTFLEYSNYHPWVDWAKFFGIYLVVLGHGGLISTNATQYIYSFHMPLFFILSGYLYKPRMLKEELKKGIDTLLIPYLCMNILCFILSLVFYLIHPPYSLTPILQRLGGILGGLGYNTEFLRPVSTPTWFLIALFIVKIIVSLINSLFKHDISLYILSLGCVLCIFIFNNVKELGGGNFFSINGRSFFCIRI